VSVKASSVERVQAAMVEIIGRVVSRLCLLVEEYEAVSYMVQATDLPLIRHRTRHPRKISRQRFITVWESILICSYRTTSIVH